MTLEERYNNASPTNTYVGMVRTKQEEAVGAGAGVNFLDGEPVAQKALPPNAYQREFTRNAAGALKYGAVGQNGQIPGSDTTDDTSRITPSTGLTRWTKTALEKAFLSGNSSLLSKYKLFKGTTVHKYTPVDDFKKILNGQTIKTAYSTVTGVPSGPAPTGLQG